MFERFVLIHIHICFAHFSMRMYIYVCVHIFTCMHFEIYMCNINRYKLLLFFSYICTCMCEQGIKLCTASMYFQANTGKLVS